MKKGMIYIILLIILGLVVGYLAIFSNRNNTISLSSAGGSIGECCEGLVEIADASNLADYSCEEIN